MPRIPSLPVQPKSPEDREFRRTRAQWALAIALASLQAAISVFLHGEIGYALATGGSFNPPMEEWPVWILDGAATTGLCLVAGRALYWVLRSRTPEALSVATIRYVFALGGLLLFTGAAKLVLGYVQIPADPTAAVFMALGLGVLSSGMRGVVARALAWTLGPVRHRMALHRARLRARA